MATACGSPKSEKIVDVVAQLPEISLVENHIQKSTNGKSVVKLWIHEQSSENPKSLWWIKVGEDNGENMSTHINFKLNETGTQIWFYEIPSDSLIPLDDWRKSVHYPFK